MLSTLLALGVGALLGALEWRRLARRHPSLNLESSLTHARHLLLTLPLVAGLLGVQIALVTHPDLAWDVPVWLELHYTDLVFGAVAATTAFLFGLTLQGAARVAYRRALPVAAFACGVEALVLAAQWHFIAPIGSELGNREVDGVVLQSSPASCAAASAANLVRQYGIELGEGDMAELLGTTRYGTSPAQMIAGLKKLGLTCRKRARSPNDPSSVRAPAILLYSPEARFGVGHAVLMVRVDHDSVVILDPMRGRVILTPAELATRWRGHAVECDAPT